MALPKPSAAQNSGNQGERARQKMFAVPAAGDGLAWLSDEDIRRKAGAQIYAKGYAYFRAEAVFDLYRVARNLQATVAGSGLAPYRVRIQLGARQIEQVSCSCPHPAEFCKHVVAVLLTLKHRPELLQVAPSLEAELRRLSKQELTDLLLQLQQQEPELGYRIYRELTRPATALSSPPASLRRLEKSAQERLAVLQPDQLQEPGSLPALLDISAHLVDEIRGWLAAGQPEAALAMLGPLSDFVMPEPDRFLDAYGNYAQAELLEEIGQLWVQVLLLTGDAAGPIAAWLPQLRSWQRRLAGQGLGSALHPVLSLLEASETLDLLAAAMQGAVEPDSWAQQSSEEIDRLAAVQLQLLRQQGRRDAALRLALASGQHTAYALLLIEQGEAVDAVSYLLERLAPGLDLLTICGSLMEYGEEALALRLAGEALAARLSNYRLTVWLRDTAARIDTELARLAAWQAVLQQTHLEDFVRLKALSGDSWGQVREKFLAQLRDASKAWPPQMIDILLAEDETAEAMAIASRYPQDAAAVQRLVKALLTREPAWSKEVCRQQAELLMQAGESRLYPEAVNWLKQMRQACFLLGQEAEWSEILAELIQRYHRKYALRPLLESLR